MSPSKPIILPLATPSSNNTTVGMVRIINYVCSVCIVYVSECIVYIKYARISILCVCMCIRMSIMCKYIFIYIRYYITCIHICKYRHISQTNNHLTFSTKNSALSALILTNLLSICCEANIDK